MTSQAQPVFVRIADIYERSPLMPSTRTERDRAFDLWERFGGYISGVIEPIKRSGIVWSTGDPEPYVSYAVVNGGFADEQKVVLT